MPSRIAFNKMIILCYKYWQHHVITTGKNLISARSGRPTVLRFRFVNFRITVTSILPVDLKNLENRSALEYTVCVSGD